MTTGKDDFPEAVGLVIAYAEGGFVGAVGFLAGRHRSTTNTESQPWPQSQCSWRPRPESATGQSLEQVLALLWDMEIGGPLEIDGPLLGDPGPGGLLHGTLKRLALCFIDAGTDHSRSSINHTVFPSHSVHLRLDGRMTGALMKLISWEE